MLTAIDWKAENAAVDFVHSLHATGFAVLRGSPLDAALLRRIYDDWRAFFGSADKHAWRMQATAETGNIAGLVPAEVSETAVGHTVKDLKEFYHVIPGQPLPPQLAPDILTHLDAAFRTGCELLAWLQRATPPAVTAPLAVALDKMPAKRDSLLRVLHYPPLAGDEDARAVRAAAHEDINLLTLLPVADQPGLQILDRAGRWLDVVGEPGDLIINAGDMLCEATGGYYPSTTHRVVNPAGKLAQASRVSLPYFLTPRLDTVLSARYTAGSYLAERLRLINR